MAHTPWTLEQFKAQLGKRKEIRAWIITQENAHRRERYFMLDRGSFATDQDREVHAQTISAKIFVNNGKPGRQGEISKKFFSSLPLNLQIDAAVESALQTDHQAWELPEKISEKTPSLATTDPRMGEDLENMMNQLTDQIRDVVAEKRASVFNSSELFMSVHHRQLHLSNGLIHRSSQSRIYAEAAYSFARKEPNGETRSDEYLNTAWSVNLNDLNIKKLFNATAERAEHSLDTAKPSTGKYPVIIDAEVLATLFNGHLSQLSASHHYNGLPFMKPGDSLIPEATGDLMTITLDPSAAYGADTTAISEQGILQSSIKLVEKNRILATMTDKQYADYLGTEPNTVRGNVSVEPGTLSFEQLTKQAPKVIEILQFSGLFADPNSGTFGSEIRLARLYDNESGKISYLKGGSLSGSIVENFKGVRLSNSRVRHSLFYSNNPQGQGYFGPEFALLSDVSIVS